MAYSYEDVIAVASKKADEIGEPLYLDKGLAREIQADMMLDYLPLLSRIKFHLRSEKTNRGHGLSHLVYVASNACFISIDSMIEMNLLDQDPQIIDRTIKFGLLHDIERWRGYGEIHAIEGAKVADKILSDIGMQDPYMNQLVRTHEEVNYTSFGNPLVDIPAAAVYDVDHFLWFTYIRNDYWLGMQDKGLPVEQAISELDHLKKIQGSWRSSYGKSVGPLLEAYGIGIAEHIKQEFPV